MSNEIKKILIYKRTHVGDPNPQGEFGINDCMGEIRNYDFDAVIGVGGIGSEPKSYGIAEKINWVGIKPVCKQLNSEHYRAEVVTFDQFVLLEDTGIQLEKLAPKLATHLLKDLARFVFTSMNPEEYEEALLILEWSKSQKSITVEDYNKLIKTGSDLTHCKTSCTTTISSCC